MDDPELQVPPLDPQLIKALDLRFPSRCPDPADSEREVWMKVGRRQVVDWLVLKFKEQTEPDVHPPEA